MVGRTGHTMIHRSLRASIRPSRESVRFSFRAVPTVKRCNGLHWKIFPSFSLVLYEWPLHPCGSPSSMSIRRSPFYCIIKTSKRAHAALWLRNWSLQRNSYKKQMVDQHFIRIFQQSAWTGIFPFLATKYLEKQTVKSTFSYIEMRERFSATSRLQNRLNVFQNPIN